MTLNPALIQRGGQTLPQLYPEERIVLHRDSVDAEFGGVYGQTWKCVIALISVLCFTLKTCTSTIFLFAAIISGQGKDVATKVRRGIVKRKLFAGVEECSS